MSLIKEYFELSDKYQREYGEKTVLLMQVGSFFECYGYRDNETMNYSGSKIEEMTRICELNIANKHICVGEKNVVMAGFIVPILEKYVKKLQEAGFTTVVYKQDIQCKNATRSLEGIYSPGTFFSDESAKLTNHIACVWVHFLENKFALPSLPKGKYVFVGVADVDILTGKTTVFQFQEIYMHSPTTYDELERFISIHNPSEVIFLSNLPCKEREEVIQFSNIQAGLIHKVDLCQNEFGEKDIALCPNPGSKDISLLPLVLKGKKCEKQTYQKEILQKFYEGNQMESLDYYVENVYACQAFCFLLDFVHEHNPFLVRKLLEPVFENKTNRLQLANHSLQQLNIIEDGRTNNTTERITSVEKMLNLCITPMGKRTFSYMLLNPITNAEELTNEYNTTEYLLSCEEVKREKIKQALESVKDISKWNRQIVLRKISPKCFSLLYANIQTIRELFVFLRQDTTLLKYFYEKNPSFCEKSIELCCERWLNVIEKTINLEVVKEMENVVNGDENFIQFGVHEELDKKTAVSTNSKAKMETIRNYLNEMLIKYEKKSKSQANTEYVKFHETEKNCIRLVATKRRCSLIKTLLPKDEITDKIPILSFLDEEGKEKTFSFHCHQKNVLFELQGTSNQSIHTPEIEELGRTIFQVKTQMREIIEKVYLGFLESLEKYQKEMNAIIDFVTAVDLLYTKAKIAKKYNYCKPCIETNETGKSFLRAKALRHCLIENIQQNELYVANDIVFGQGVQDGILLYGTNAVGKTSFIKSVGVALIMAQAGLFVPASSFVYYPYTCLFTRILGNDNIFKGLSTFAVEMSELRTILKQADEKSLILGDELCSGTESISAISIFVAGVEKLHEKKSSFIFATHLHEIVDYEEVRRMERMKIKHMAVVFDREKDILVYDRKLRDGAGDNMYGLEVCKSLHLPFEFLERANHLRLKYFPDANNILSLGTSHFNSKKIVGKCEECGKNLATEVHHLQHQKDANQDGFIEKEGEGAFHKNHPANLISLCETCHDAFHKEKTQHKKVKTSKGHILETI